MNTSLHTTGHIHDLNLWSLTQCDSYIRSMCCFLNQHNTLKKNIFWYTGVMGTVWINNTGPMFYSIYLFSIYSLSFSSCSWQNDSCFLCSFSCSCFTSDWTRFLSSCSASNCITTSEKEKPVLNAGNTSFSFHCKQCVFSFHMCWSTTFATVLYCSCHCYHISFEKKRQMTEIRECTWNPHHDRIFLNHELKEHIKILYPYLLSTPCSYWMIIRKIENTKTWKRKYYIALCGELALDRLQTCHNTNYITNEYAEKHATQVLKFPFPSFP